MGVMNMMPCVKNTNNKSAHESEMSMKKTIKGTVVLMKRNVLDVKDFGASFFDWVYETIFHKRVSIQLISSTHCDPSNGLNGKIGKAAFIEDWTTKKTEVAAGEASFSVTFEWDESMGVPGAFLIKNHHRRQFYLKTVELEHVPGQFMGLPDPSLQLRPRLLL